MNINSIQNANLSFSSLKIRVKDNGDPARKQQLEQIKAELPMLEQMQEVDKYQINIKGVGSDAEADSWEGPRPYLEISAKRPGLLNTKTARLHWTNPEDGTIQDKIKNAVSILLEKESRKDNGIKFDC
ncbi:MAG: hypothetical protein IJY61_07550 [Candidatus Gastranaerophilales bacterium]|nr:hypothetical protein [Candidatus Gastranaerophilales bacterium]